MMEDIDVKIKKMVKEKGIDGRLKLSWEGLGYFGKPFVVKTIF